MSLEDHILTLKTKHATLERALKQERLRPQPDTQQIAKLKREKLRLKDEIAKLALH